MTVDGGAAGYVRIAAELIAATFGGERSEQSHAAAGVTRRPCAVSLAAGDRLRPRRAAAFARAVLAHDAARAGASRSRR